MTGESESGAGQETIYWFLGENDALDQAAKLAERPDYDASLPVIFFRNRWGGEIFVAWRVDKLPPSLEAEAKAKIERGRAVAAKKGAASKERWDNLEEVGQLPKHVVKAMGAVGVVAGIAAISVFAMQYLVLDLPASVQALLVGEDGRPGALLVGVVTVCGLAPIVAVALRFFRVWKRISATEGT